MTRKVQRSVFPLIVIAAFLMASLPHNTYSDAGALLPVVQEREPNNTIARAQRLNVRSVVSGKLEHTDPVFDFVFLDVAGLVDNYRVMTTSPGLLVGDLSFGRGLVVGELAPDVMNGNGPILDSFLEFFPGIPGFLGGYGDPNLCLLALAPVRVIDRSINGWEAIPEFGLGGSDLPAPPPGFGLAAIIAANDQANRAESIPKVPRRSAFGGPVVPFPPGNYFYAIWDGTTDILDIIFTSFLVMFVDVEGNIEIDNLNPIVFTSDTPSPYQLKVGFQPALLGQPIQEAPLPPEAPAKFEPPMKFQHLNQMGVGNLGRKIGQRVSDAYKLTVKEDQTINFDLVFDRGTAGPFQVFKAEAGSYRLVATADWTEGPADVGAYMKTGKLSLAAGDYYITIPGKAETLYTLSATNGSNPEPLSYTFKLTPTRPLISFDLAKKILGEVAAANQRGEVPILNNIVRNGLNE